MTKTLGNTKGIAKLPERYARDVDMVSRGGTYSSFTDGNSVSRNIARASNGGSDTTWDNNHILIHNIKVVNTSDDQELTVSFYQNNDETSADAISSTNRVFELWLAGANQDRAGHTLQIDFPIPLCIKGGCYVTANYSGPIVHIVYTVLNTSDDNEYENTLKFKYLSAATHNSTTADVLHGDGLPDIASDVEIWGGVLYNHSTTSDRYTTATILSVGESDLVKCSLVAAEQKTATDDASAAYTAPYKAMFWPYPVICKNGAKMDNQHSTGHATWFYRERNSVTRYAEGWA